MSTAIHALVETTNADSKASLLPSVFVGIATIRRQPFQFGKTLLRDNGCTTGCTFRNAPIFCISFLTSYRFFRWPQVFMGRPCGSCSGGRCNFCFSFFSCEPCISFGEKSIERARNRI